MSLRAAINEVLGEGVDPQLVQHTAEVSAGDVFLALADKDAASRHAQEAIASGASCVFSPYDLAGEWSVPVQTIPQLAEDAPAWVAEYYGRPSQQLQVFAVTGTNGKTSVAYFIADMLQRSGKCSGYIGTLGWGTLDHIVDPNLTTPNMVALQRRLRQMQGAGAQGVALEVSSHALDQQRLGEVDINIAIFTNLTRDHLDYHGDMQAYGAAKMRLFTDWTLQAAVVNVEDPFSEQISAQCQAPLVTYGRSENADWYWTRISDDKIRWSGPDVDFTVPLQAPADFMLDNLTAALAALARAGLAAERLPDLIKTASGVPGRLEVVSRVGQPTVVVDYAHTPDAVEKVLEALRTGCAGRLICVVGCGGDRDPGKRPQMAAAASRLADEVWLTADNPRSEAPLDIITQMEPGLIRPARIEADRRSAIAGAIAGATRRDTVLIAGKGHEDYQEINGVRHPFDDRVVAREILDAMEAEI